MSYSMPELIGTKRDGGVLAAEELEWIISLTISCPRS